MIKVDVKEKEPSVSRPETQTAAEVRKEGEGEKTKEIQEDKSEEAAKRGTKEVQTSMLKAEKDSQKTTQTNTVQCKVTFLHGPECTCDLEMC